MFQLYSKGCEYAIKALIQMQDPNQNYDAEGICKRARIPESFSRKIFQALVRGKFLRAVPGPGGGYQSRKHAKKITVLDIVRAVDGPKAFNSCIMGLSICGKESPCPLHESWAKAKFHLIEELEGKKLLDLIHHQNRKKISKK